MKDQYFRDIHGHGKLRQPSKTADGDAVPVVRKETVSLVAIGDALEAMTLRAVLEYFNYRVDVHWIGSRGELRQVLRGEIETCPRVVLSCHGDDAGGILVPGEPPICVEDLDVRLPGRLVLNLGCGTGRPDAAARYLRGGCHAYVAPCRAVEGNASLLFAVHLFYFLGRGMPLSEAVQQARAHDEECALFELWEGTPAR